MIVMVIVILAGCLLIFCLMPLLIRVVTRFIKTDVKWRMATQVLLLKGYQKLPQDDVL